MKNTVFVTLIVLVSLGIAGCNRQEKTEQVVIRMATGEITGTYYGFGTVVAPILSEAINIPITVQPSTSSKANILQINSGEVEIAIAQNDVMDYAWRGADLFNGEIINSFSCIAALYAEVCQIVINPVSGIKTVADLKGKNVSVGDAGGVVEYNARQILDAYDITFDDIAKQNLGFGASADALRENKIDAFFCIAGSPTPAVANLAADMDVAILEIDDEHADRLMTNYRFYTRYPIPAGSYRGQDDEIQTVAVKAVFIVSSGLSQDTVYQLTKALFENKAQIEAAHVKGRELSPSFAVENIPVPFHIGAAKYLVEIGAFR